MNAAAGVAGEDDVDAVKRHRIEQQTLAVVHKSVATIAAHELEHSAALPLSRGAVAGVAEAAMHVLNSVVADSLAFANHAGRRNVGERDVLLCARRTPQNHVALKAFLVGLGASDADLDASKKKAPRAKKRRPTVLADDDELVNNNADADDNDNVDDDDNQ